MKIILRLWVEGKLMIEIERFETGGDPRGGEEFARRAQKIADGRPHLIEMEFPDEPDPLQRFFPFGTDPRPLAVVEFPSITCPLCHRRSYHPRDIEEKYCGFCHEFRRQA